MYIDALEVSAPVPKDVAGEVSVAGALASERSYEPSRGGAPQRLRDAPHRDGQERRAIARRSGGATYHPGAMWAPEWSKRVEN